MTKQSRFSVSGHSKIEEKYVLYVEDLYVSFKGNSFEKDINKKINLKRRQLNKLTKKEISRFPDRFDELKRELQILTDEKNFVSQRKEVAQLNEKLTKAKNIKEEKEISSQIEDLLIDMDPKSKRKRVLKGVTFGLRKGETLALVGANGAGKTVMLETILGLNIPDKYKRIVLNLGEKTYLENLKHVGIQYQQSKIPSKLKTKNAIAAQKKLYKGYIVESEVDKMIEVFGITPFLNSKVQSLSGGQKQRLNLLLAVMHQPKLMILDEFITGLDVRSVRKIITYVNELKIKNNASMIIVSHQPEEIQELSDRIIVMKNGKMTNETTTAQVLKEYPDMASFVEEVI